MKDMLKVEGFFSFSSDGVMLSEYGIKGTKQLLAQYSGGQIKEISGVSRSALTNYVYGANRISKRGQEALKRLIFRYNDDLPGSPRGNEIAKNIKLYSDRELLEELKCRGFNVFISI